jgi:O-methyltransferase/methyltransferase family protein
MATPSRSEAAATLRQISFGMRASQALYVAAKLNVADHLAHKPMRVDELATLTQSDPQALSRLLRALCALGVFTESQSGEISLNPTAELLRSDVPGSFRGAVLMSAGQVRWRCWADLLHVIQTGEGGTERVLGMGLFDFYGKHPEESLIHDQAMRSISAAQVSAVLKAFDFSKAGRVVDVGGGTGELLSAILGTSRSLEGTLFDLPHVVANARGVLSEAGILERVHIVPGSFLEGAPPAGDTLLLKTIIHDWDDARAEVILLNCRKAVSSQGRLLIIERELPNVGEHRTAIEPFLLDLEMLVMSPGGRERTRQEFANLLSAAQFDLVRVVTTEAPVSIFEARPA